MDHDSITQWKKLMHNKPEALDLSRDADLSIAVMNLVSLEEHLFFSYAKTKSATYIDTLVLVRDLRKKFLGQLLIAPVAEEWCISKHLLVATMRLFETGTKELGAGNKKSAESFFTDAYSLYVSFWSLNTKVQNAGVKNRAKKTNPSQRTRAIPFEVAAKVPATLFPLAKKPLGDRLKEKVTALVNCCIE